MGCQGALSLATWALGEILLKARALGLDRVLGTCDDANTASARTVERNSGVLEDVRRVDGGLKRRYRDSFAVFRPSGLC
ncbi:hypothetical protein [Streptomyces sp. NPDC048002]|uniref:GNAT family N-acetyltransferase n=1 Tax=Streptomyces sp. NPDC048002 TaxID=3154344 RepID=UPI0033DCAC4B